MDNISRKRGDTRRIRRTVKLAGAAVNITNWSFLLTINREPAPTDTSNQIAQIPGTIYDAQNGIVDFYPTEAEVDHVGTFYFDIQLIDAAGEISTYDDGEFVLNQDKTKSGEHTVELDSFGADGTVIIADGLAAPWISYYYGYYNDPLSAMKAATRDTRRTVEFFHPVGFASWTPPGFLLFGGQAGPGRIHPIEQNLELSMLTFVDQARAVVRFELAGSDAWGEVSINQTPTGTSMFTGTFIQQPETWYPWPDHLDHVTTAEDPAMGPGWYWVKMYLEKGWTSLRGKVWPDGDPEPASWLTNVAPENRPAMPVDLMFFCDANGRPTTADMIGEIATVKYRVWR